MHECHRLMELSCCSTYCSEIVPGTVLISEVEQQKLGALGLPRCLSFICRRRMSRWSCHVLMQNCYCSDFVSRA